MHRSTADANDRREFCGIIGRAPRRGGEPVATPGYQAEEMRETGSPAAAGKKKRQFHRFG